MALGPAVSRPVCLEVKDPSGAYDQICITVRQLRVCDVGRSLWREGGSVVYNFSWPSPGQLFLGPSPVGLVILFYCLRFKTSLFVASYDSQGYGGGILFCLYTDRSLQLNYTDSYILSAPTTHRKHSSSVAECMSAGVPTWSLPSQSHWLLPSNGFGPNYIENTASVFLAACLFERVYLATGVSGSIS
jgi:hypothetical protein